MPSEIKHVPNELVDSAAILVSKLYITYYEVNPKVTPIQELKGVYHSIEFDPTYDVPIICAVLLQILIESPNSEKWANLILQTYKSGVDSGLTEYDAMLNVVGAFKLVWDNHLPNIELKDNVELYVGGVLAKLKEEGKDVPETEEIEDAGTE